MLVSIENAGWQHIRITANQTELKTSSFKTFATGETKIGKKSEKTFIRKTYFSKRK